MEFPQGMGEGQPSYGDMANFKFHKAKRRKWRQKHRHGWATEGKQRRFDYVRKEFENEKYNLLKFQ